MLISACDTKIGVNLVLCKTKYHSRVNTFYSSLDNRLDFKGLVRIKYFEKIYFDTEKWIFTGIFPLLLIKTGSNNIDPLWFLSMVPLCSLGFGGTKEAP
jgi:hypothetical protein